MLASAAVGRGAPARTTTRSAGFLQPALLPSAHRAGIAVADTGLSLSRVGAVTATRRWRSFLHEPGVGARASDVGTTLHRPLPVEQRQGKEGACVLGFTVDCKFDGPKFRCEYRVALQEGHLATTFKVQNMSTFEDTFTTYLQGILHRPSSECQITGSFKGATKFAKMKSPNKTTSMKFYGICKGVLPGTVTISDPPNRALDIVCHGGWRDVEVAGGFYRGCHVCFVIAAFEPVALPPNGVWEATMNLVPSGAA